MAMLENTVLDVVNEVKPLVETHGSFHEVQARVRHFHALVFSEDSSASPIVEILLREGIIPMALTPEQIKTFTAWQEISVILFGKFNKDVCERIQDSFDESSNITPIDILKGINTHHGNWNPLANKLDAVNKVASKIGIEFIAPKVNSPMDPEDHFAKYRTQTNDPGKNFTIAKLKQPGFKQGNRTVTAMVTLYAFS